MSNTYDRQTKTFIVYDAMAQRNLLDRPIDKVIDFLKGLKKEYSTDDIKICLNTDYDGRPELEIVITHVESDEEYEERIKEFEEEQVRKKIGVIT